MAKHFTTDEVYCSPYEHESVLNVSDYILKNNKKKFDIQQYGLYCHQFVNQITGDIWDIENIKKEIITKSNQFFSVDVTAALGHVKLPENIETYCDALWFSGHKIYTEKNIGALWISERLARFLQYEQPKGTIDVQGVFCLADALKNLHYSQKELENNFKELLEFLEAKLKQNNINYQILSKHDKKSEAINAIYFEGINADALQTYLASKKIYIGVGHSACSAESDYRVLNNMGYNNEIARQTVRISFGADNNNKDITELVKEIKNFKEMF